MRIRPDSVLDDGLDNILMMDSARASEAVCDRPMPGQREG